MMMAAGRDRGRSQRPEDRQKVGRRTATPSRFLWVGNLSDDMTKDILVNHMLRFGELERVSFQPGRNFAFVDYRDEEAAFAAMRALHGSVLAGSRILVEFTKDSKFSSQPFEEEIHKTTEDVPPSETLWVGYPPHLEIDEIVLRKAFAPFGALRKVTTLSDRKCAFVCFETVSAASRAKMALDGRLFSNPRVQIRFARSEHDSGRYSKNILLSPSFEQRSFRNSSHYNGDFQDNSIIPSCHGAKKLRTGSYPPEDDLPEFSLSVPPTKLELKEWAWEGVIAKGGKLVCRARCFPKGKPMDMMLPACVDVTAKTSIERLSKHYYEARNSWVVFFVPRDDADMDSYNEYMHYLEEKQQVAVATINENTSLFLIAPCDFTENVLKVPGKLSISGVVLRLEPQIPSPSTEPTNSSTRDPSFVTQHNPRAVQEQPRISPAGPLPTLQPEQIAQLATSILGKRAARPSDNTYGVHQGYPAVQNNQATNGVGYSSGYQVIAERPKSSPAIPVAALQSEQLAHLASSFGGPSSAQPVQQQQGLDGSRGSSTAETFQATLQLAASLLQSIQQRKGT